MNRPKKKFSPCLLQKTKYVAIGAWIVFSAIGGGALSSFAQAEEIKLAGSGTDLGTMRMMADAYRKSYPGAQIKVLKSLGSGGGVRALLERAIDIALTSRPLKEKERENEIVSWEYGRTPVVFVTAKEKVPTGLTSRELVDIYSGKIVRWPDGSPLRLVLRQLTESSTVLLKSISPEMRRAVDMSYKRQGLKIALTDQLNLRAVETIPGALGVSTLSQVLSENSEVKALSLNGVHPGPKGISDKSYPYYKRLFFVVWRKSASRLARRFIDFAYSSAGREILVRTGHQVVSRKD